MVTLIGLITHASNATDIDNGSYSQEDLTISQLIASNTARHTYEKNIHSHFDKDTLLQLYVGMYLHSKTRPKTIIETFNKLGICVGYRRVLAVSTDIANNAIAHFETVGAVCPQSLKLHVSTMAAIDNIDKNFSSASLITSLTK